MMQKLTFLVLSLFLTSLVFGQYEGVVTYDFRDGAIISAGMSPDGKLKLSGTYSYHSANYGLNMKVNGELAVDVPGSCTVRFLGSQYSGLKMVGTATTDGDLGTQNTKVTQDRVDVFDFVYSGKAATLRFKLIAGTGNDLYLPKIDVIPAQKGIATATAEKNIAYYFDFRDGSIIPTTTDGKSNIDTGLVKVVVGPSNAYGYNGTQHGSILKTGNQIILNVAGNSRIKVGGSIYSNGTVAVSSTTGLFDAASKSATTSGNFGNDGSTVDFLYVGTAGAVTLAFTSTTYVPYIEISPVPYEVTLTPYVKKSGTITVNNVQIGLTSGDDASSNATVTLSEGTVISATNEKASVLINLGGKALSAYTPTVAGDIDTVTVKGDSLLVAYKDTTSNPKSYLIVAKDNSVKVEAEPGKTYIYKFYDGSELPQIGYTQLRYTVYVSKDGLLTMKSNTDVASGQFGFHDATHGGVFFPGNSFEFTVAGNAIITFFVDTYGVAKDAVFEFKGPNGNVLGSIRAENLGGQDGFPSAFAYKGPKGVVTATIKSALYPGAEIYLHGVNVENAAKVSESNGKTDVWDFGAVQLDTALYNNQLNEDIINSWYAPTITKGSTGIVLPNFIAGALSWVGGTNDRLRSTNKNLTRYDENIASVTGYTGRIYVNSGANVNRYLSLTLSDDDEITVITKTDAGGTINFQYVDDPAAQTDAVPITSSLTELKFVAKKAGTYHLFDTQGKPSYYRVYRKDATYVSLAGTVDLTQAAGIPSNFALVFTNKAGKSWQATPSGGAFSVQLPAGFSYNVSLAGANGYLITAGDSLYVADTTTTHQVTILKLALNKVSGAITGLGSAISRLTLVYTPKAANAVYAPQPVINADSSTYQVYLEPNVPYTLSALGVNDYFIPADTLTILPQDTVIDVAFQAKAVFKVAITTTGLNAEQSGKLGLVFSNLNESGYSYSFASLDSIALRNGVYQIAQSGLDKYPVELGLTSNLTIAGADASKALVFYPVTNWPFDDRAIVSGDSTYKGLLFSGNLYNEVAKGHLAGGAGAAIKVPVNPGEKITVSYYYTADFSINGGQPVTTNTQSTGTIESVDYAYPADTAGYATITFGAGASTTYLTHISRTKNIPYTATLRVGPDKDYLTINGALAAVRSMNRGANDRVTILIDPGNYEEMLLIDRPNITLKNAAVSPSIGLLNKGVDIAPGAVRVTSYYGHGYNYYSMGTDQKWNAEILRVNKENGSLSYENKGAGTTNGSYWNATVAVFANGFEAEDLIFENSFNQYISKKESEDKVVMWASGSKGLRPTDIGNTAVQNRSFVERAAALAIGNNVDKTVLKKCRVIGRQDSFFGGNESRVVVYKGAVMGAVDYLFGGMIAVFYKTDLVMNTSDVSGDAAYLTAAQQGSGRGYLMYECKVTSPTPGVETASAYRSKPGYFGRPWQATTSEVVFYNTTIETSDFPGAEGKSLVEPLGWQNSLGGESKKMYEYGTIELSGVNNGASRATWATLLTTPVLTDGTDITTFNFTKGTDGWDPLPALIAADVTSVRQRLPETAVKVHAFADKVYISRVTARTNVRVYSINGTMTKAFDVYGDTDFPLAPGFWFIQVQAADGIKTVKVTTF